MEFCGARPDIDLTYSDVFLIPRRSAVASRLAVDLAPTGVPGMTIPLISANMNSVTGPRIAATLARRGGLGVLPQDLGAQELDAAIRWVKAQSPLWDVPVVRGPDVPVELAARALPPVAGYGVVVSSNPQPRLEQVEGIVAASVLASAMPGARLGDLVRGRPVSIEAEDVGPGRHTFDILRAAESEMACVVSHGQLVGTISPRSALRNTLYAPALDADGRLLVAAAIGINRDPVARAKALVSAGVDVIVIDTAHGHQDAMHEVVKKLATEGLGVPLVAGNVVTGDGVADLVEAGANIIKVGVGPGAMCTTRMMTAVGRPQFSAVMECAQAASAAGATVWADGGVRYPRDVALGLAAGADAVMIGSWFAGTIEAPGDVLLDAEGRAYKESWGMASAKAVHDRFGSLDAYELARKELFAEGISSSRIYLDPVRPSVEDLVDMITSGVRSSFSYAGAATLAQFHQNARVGVQSAAGYEEGKALPVSW